MSNIIAINYDELSQNKNDVEGHIYKIVDTIEKINEECNKITNEEVWSGIVATKFSEVKKTLMDYSIEKILEIKKTNEFKEYVNSTIKNAEQSSASGY